MKHGYRLIALLLVIALLTACGNTGNYIKEHYSLIDVQGQGKSTAKVYLAEGTDVVTVAGTLAEQEKPKEISKESTEQMFLVYDSKIIHLQKDPNQQENTLIEVDSVEYAKENYDSSFLQGYLTAALIQSVFGSDWSGKHSGGKYDYRGYTSTKRYQDYGKYQSVPYPSGSSGSSSGSKSPAAAPATTERKGSFSSTPSGSKTPSQSTGQVRRSDGSTPTYKAPSSSASKPSTSKRTGSFKKK
ncbi:DUF4247 domain-containing protein [Paenibacillus silviterrae]|uniref:DUF4247 domain-containing protein n=1 Tax=Paenibacillus silviterrae TaxID=3242194 RepID=UPI002542741F|nr:DUF4247 domain-containing protein [Paenibacillus chinjuensis]